MYTNVVSGAGKIASKHLAGYSLTFFDKIHSVPNIWDELVQHKDLFWQRSYFESLEKNPIEGLQHYFAIVYLNNVPAGCFFFHRKFFIATEAIGGETKEPNGSIATCFRSLIAGHLCFDILFCGNLLLTGNYGHYIVPNSLYSEADLIDETMKLALSYLGTKGKKPDLFFIKDQLDNSGLQALTQKQYKQFSTLPDMGMNIHEDWHDYNDYLQALSSKYRVRAKRAATKLIPITSRLLSIEDLYHYKDRMHELYKQVIGDSDFNLVKLPLAYFCGLQEALGAAFDVHGYFDASEKMVGFITTIRNNDVMEAHFLGYDLEANTKHQLYLNMLFNMVALAINSKMKTLHFARTAMEIKSSVGAEALVCNCYFKHRKSAVNSVLHLLFDYMNKETEWVPRSPFKD